MSATRIRRTPFWVFDRGPKAVAGEQFEKGPGQAGLLELAGWRENLGAVVGQDGLDESAGVGQKRGPAGRASKGTSISRTRSSSDAVLPLNF